MDNATDRLPEIPVSGKLYAICSFFLSEALRQGHLIYPWTHLGNIREWVCFDEGRCIGKVHLILAVEASHHSE